MLEPLELGGGDRSVCCHRETALSDGVQSQKIEGVHLDRTPIEFLADEYPSSSVVQHSTERMS